MVTGLLYYLYEIIPPKSYWNDLDLNNFELILKQHEKPWHCVDKLTDAWNEMTKQEL